MWVCFVVAPTAPASTMGSSPQPAIQEVKHEGSVQLPEVEKNHGSFKQNDLCDIHVCILEI